MQSRLVTFKTLERLQPTHSVQSRSDELQLGTKQNQTQVSGDKSLVIRNYQTQVYYRSEGVIKILRQHNKSCVLKGSVVMLKRKLALLTRNKKIKRYNK